MLSFTKSKSSLLLLLLCLSFFSCEQLLEIIKPHLPKPDKETCRLEIERFQDGNYISYHYDSLSRLSSTVFTDFSSGEDTVYYPTYYSYNEKNQLVSQFRQVVVEGGSRKGLQYDAVGRVIKVETVNIDPDFLRQVDEYSYLQDTIKVKSTAKDEPWGEFSTSEKMYIFQHENLVKIRYADSTGSYAAGKEATFSYTTMLNKKSRVEKRLVFIESSPLMSKNLVSRAVDSEGRVTTFVWEVNPQGYVVKQTRTDPYATYVWTYEYHCEEK